MIRPAPKLEVTTVLEQAPGAEGHVDWSLYTVKLAGETRVAHAFSMVLPFSRYMVVRSTFKILDTLHRLHQEAFADIEGIPKLMTYDNMTTVGRNVGEDEIQLNPRFEAYTTERGFDVWLIDLGGPNYESLQRPAEARRRAGHDPRVRRAARDPDQAALVAAHPLCHERYQRKVLPGARGGVLARYPEPPAPRGGPPSPWSRRARANQCDLWWSVVAMHIKRSMHLMRNRFCTPSVNPVRARAETRAQSSGISFAQ